MGELGRGGEGDILAIGVGSGTLANGAGVPLEGPGFGNDLEGESGTGWPRGDGNEILEYRVDVNGRDIK